MNELVWMKQAYESNGISGMYAICLLGIVPLLGEENHYRLCPNFPEGMVELNTEQAESIFPPELPVGVHWNRSGERIDYEFTVRKNAIIEMQLPKGWEASWMPQKKFGEGTYNMLLKQTG